MHSGTVTVQRKGADGKGRQKAIKLSLQKEQEAKEVEIRPVSPSSPTDPRVITG